MLYYGMLWYAMMSENLMVFYKMYALLRDSNDMVWDLNAVLRLCCKVCLNWLYAGHSKVPLNLSLSSLHMRDVIIGGFKVDRSYIVSQLGKLNLAKLFESVVHTN